MDSKEGDDVESLSMRREMLLKLRQRIEKANSELQASGSSASSISQELEQLVKMTGEKAQEPSKVQLQIHDELDKVFAAEEVGHSCDLCQRDLATDPERPGGSLRILQEACVLACGHAYHFKCLRGSTLDLDNLSADPSCIFCISSSN